MRGISLIRVFPATHILITSATCANWKQALSNRWRLSTRGAALIAPVRTQTPVSMSSSLYVHR